MVFFRSWNSKWEIFLGIFYCYEVFLRPIFSTVRYFFSVFFFFMSKASRFLMQTNVLEMNSDNDLQTYYGFRFKEAKNARICVKTLEECFFLELTAARTPSRKIINQPIKILEIITVVASHERDKTFYSHSKSVLTVISSKSISLKRYIGSIKSIQFYLFMRSCDKSR